LQVRQDDFGLAFSARLSDDRDARPVLTAVRYGSLTGCSFGFKATRLAEDEDGGRAADAEWLPPRLEALRSSWREHDASPPGACSRKAGGVRAGAGVGGKLAVMRRSARF
jgi:hypothetical protein